MTTQQPEALRLADIVERLNVGVHSQDIAEEYTAAARELRRLHADNEALKQEIAATHPAQQWLDAARIEMLTAIEDSGEGLRYGLECLVNNGVNTFIVYDEQREEYLGDGWLTDPCSAIDAALAAQAKQGGA